MQFFRMMMLLVVGGLATTASAEQFRFLTQTIPTPVSSNLPYTARVLTANAAGTVSFSIPVGTLPPGLVLNTATGLISGRPTNPESLSSVPFSFTLSATDGVTTLLKNFTIVVTRVELTEQENVSLLTTSFSDGEIGVTYSTPLSKEKGTGPFVFGAAGLPPGLSLDNQDAVIEGTPTAAGTYQVTLTVTDLTDGNTHATALIPLTIRPAGSALRFTNAILDNGEVGSPYQDTWFALGGTGAVTFSAENLPAGLSVDAATGVVSGQPTVAGLFRVTQIATVGGVTIRAQQFITIAPSATSTFTWQNYELPIALVGLKYDGDNPRLMSTQAPGVDDGVIYSVTGLPAVLAYNAPTAGRLSGTPTQIGSFPVTFTAFSPQQESIVYSTTIAVLARNGGDLDAQPANLFVKSQNVSNSTKPGKATWQGTFYYNADRRTGKAFDPATETFSVSLAGRTITVPPGSFSVKNSTFTFKSAKGVEPVINVTVNASTQEIKFKSSKDTFTQPVANQTLVNNTVVGGDSYSLRQDYDKAGKLLVTKGFASAGIAAKKSEINVPGPNSGTFNVSGSLGDPKFVYEPAQSNTILRIRVLNEDKEVIDYLVSSLVSVKITKDNDDRRFYKLSTKDVGLKKFTFDSKSGTFDIQFFNQTLINLSAVENHLGLELQFGNLVYFTNFTVFSDKPTKYKATIPQD